ncbi:uncharacterized protein [Montipora foliosa]|uniref:uncharacterized protein n=1 Tax=Montipora foliosa TaxID=591990 RepID=UPI0035F1942D
MTPTTTVKVIDNLEEIFSHHGLPITIKSDNGPQFISGEFQEYCLQNDIVHLKTTPKWPQANGEVERQNASLTKRIRIAQAEGVNGKKELRRYVTKYRSIDHTTTGKGSAKLLFNRKMRGKLPELHADCHLDLEARERDAGVKAKTKSYADKAANAKPSDIAVGDQVLVRQERKDKLSTPFNPTPYRVVSKTSNSVIVEAPGWIQYSRNTSHVKRFMMDDPVPTLETPSGSPDGIVVSTAVPSQVLSEPTPTVPATPHNEPPTTSLLSAQASAQNGNEAVTVRRDIVVDQATVPSTPATPRLTQRPQRRRRPPERYKDYVLK